MKCVYCELDTGTPYYMHDSKEECIQALKTVIKLYEEKDKKSCGGNCHSQTVEVTTKS